ncbi:hypothetical protein [Streptomyces sp. NPDC088141]|uniref:hypothetical protein n=1 Tax=Streptomyces sp. NPDC088141 TaxID=3155179 RepID=UPI00341E89C9
MPSGKTARERVALLGEEPACGFLAEDEERGVAAEVGEVGVEGHRPGPGHQAVHEVELGRQVTGADGRAVGAFVGAEETAQAGILLGCPGDRVVEDVPPRRRVRRRGAGRAVPRSLSGDLG